MPVCFNVHCRTIRYRHDHLRYRYGISCRFRSLVYSHHSVRTWTSKVATIRTSTWPSLFLQLLLSLQIHYCCPHTSVHGKTLPVLSRQQFCPPLFSKKGRGDCIRGQQQHVNRSYCVFFQEYFAIVVDVLCSLIQLTYRMWPLLVCQYVLNT